MEPAGGFICLNERGKTPFSHFTSGFTAGGVPDDL